MTILQKIILGHPAACQMQAGKQGFKRTLPAPMLRQAGKRSRLMIIFDKTT
jgi:hypothetical protein